MPQPRYAEQTHSFKYLVVHGHVHQTWAMVLVVLKGKQYKCGADGGGGGGKNRTGAKLFNWGGKGEEIMFSARESYWYSLPLPSLTCTIWTLRMIELQTAKY